MLQSTGGVSIDRFDGGPDRLANSCKHPPSQRRLLYLYSYKIQKDRLAYSRKYSSSFNTSCFNCIFVLVQKIQVCQLFQKKSGLQPTTPRCLFAQSSIFFLISISDEILIHLKIGTFNFPLKEVFSFESTWMLLQCVKNDRLVVWLTIKVLTFEARKISSWGNCEGLKCATWAQGNISEKGEFHKMETAYRGISFLTMDQLQKLAIEGIFKMQKRHPCPLGPAKYLIENIQSKLIVLSRSRSIQAMITVPSIFIS